MAAIEVKRPTDKELKELNIKSWSPWSCDVSRFDWEYDCEEWCYIFEGDVIVGTDDGQVEIKKGDLVKFPKGLKCTWDVKKKVEKVYLFK